MISGKNSVIFQPPKDGQVVLYLARHGTTDLNKEKRFRGSVDAPLDAEGTADAHELADLFEPVDISFIVASPKKRTQQTAKIISSRKKMDFAVHDMLAPWDIGEFGGQPKDKANILALHQYVVNADMPPPGGESLNHFRGRIQPLVSEGVQAGFQIGRPVLIVAHSSVVHEASEMITGNHMACKVKPGGVVAIYVKDGKAYAVPIFKPDINSSTQNVLGTKTTTVS